MIALANDLFQLTLGTIAGVRTARAIAHDHLSFSDPETRWAAVQITLTEFGYAVFVGGLFLS